MGVSVRRYSLTWQILIDCELVRGGADQASLVSRHSYCFTEIRDFVVKWEIRVYVVGFVIEFKSKVHI